MKPRFESLDLQGHFGIFDKRFSCDTVFEAPKFKGNPLNLENFVSPRVTNRLEPLSLLSKGNATSPQSFSIKKTRSPAASTASKLGPITFPMSSHEKKYSSKGSERNSHITQTIYEAKKAEEQRANMVLKLSQKAKEQRAQLSSLLEGGNLTTDPMSVFQTERMRLIEIAPHEFVSSPVGQHIKRRSSNRILKALDEEEGSEAYLNEYVSPREDNKNFKRRAGPPPLMNLTADLKLSLQKRKNLLQKRGDVSSLLLGNQGSVQLDATNNTKRSSFRKTIDFGNTNNTASFSPTFNAGKDFMNIIEKKLAKSKFAKKENFLIDINSLVNTDSNFLLDEREKSAVLKKFKMLKKSSLVDEINPVNFKHFYDKERGRTRYVDEIKTMRSNHNEEEEEAFENFNSGNETDGKIISRKIPSFDLFNSKVDKLIEKLDNFMGHGFGVHNVVSAGDNDDSGQEQMNANSPLLSNAKRNVKETKNLPKRSYLELIERMRACVKGLVSMKLKNLNFPMKEILSDVTKKIYFVF